MMQFNYKNDLGYERITNIIHRSSYVFNIEFLEMVEVFRSPVIELEYFALLCGNCYSPIGLELVLEYDNGYLNGLLIKRPSYNDIHIVGEMMLPLAFHIVGEMMLPLAYSEGGCIYANKKGDLTAFQCDCGCDVITRYVAGVMYDDSYHYFIAKNIILV